MIHEHNGGGFIIMYRDGTTFAPDGVKVIESFTKRLQLQVSKGDEEYLIYLNYCPICGVKSE